jgi:hypothetical protein
VDPFIAHINLLQRHAVPKCCQSLRSEGSLIHVRDRPRGEDSLSNGTVTKPFPSFRPTARSYHKCQASYQQPATMNHAKMIPLNDVREMKRTNSRGSNSDFELEEDGEENTLDYRLQAVDAVDGSRKISLWHDVSLVHLEPTTGSETEYHNFVCEIPKFSR